MKKNNQIVTTEDGSKTLWHPFYKEHYHSTHGALREALHVFIKSGWQASNNFPISILEIGFGTGLNALLTLKSAQEDEKKVYYLGIDTNPLSIGQIQQLNYTKTAELSRYAADFIAMHELPWNVDHQLSPFFTIQKKQTDIQTLLWPNNKFNLIYFDAFGPRAQPEMWTKDNLQKMYDCLQTNGIFVTYCAKGQVRRDLQSIGFEVERLDGPPGKREMLRAQKKINE